MGFGIKELLVILVIVILLFGTKRLKGLGSDLGAAIKGFRQSVNDSDGEPPARDTLPGGDCCNNTDEQKDEQKNH